ncbi:molybdopterin converting factor subunit 1 [Ferrovibrio xuzhouensis]
MTMRVLYFAWLRERVGIPEETVTPPAEVRNVGELVAWLRGRSPQHSAALADPAIVRVAVNQDYARPDHAVGPDDEIAIFPPVTGG